MQNIKYAVIGGLFGISSTTYATASEAAAVCNQQNSIVPEKQLFSVKQYERVVSVRPGEKRYQRHHRRRRICDSDTPTNPQPPTSGAPCMVVRKPTPSVTFLKAA